LTAASKLLSELESLGAELYVADGRIKINAPAGVVTAAHRDRLRESKEELLGLLSNRGAELSRPAAVIPIKAGDGAWPIFGVPGHNGDVFCYRGLASCLGSDRALFGLQPPGLDGDDGPMSRVEDMATYFAKQIAEIGPRRGPVVIAGYCAGGSVAFELAAQLRAQGQDVGLLVLMGTPYPSAYRRLQFSLIRVREYLRRIRMDSRRLRRFAEPQFIMRAIRSLRTEALTSEISEGLTADQGARRQAVQKATFLAAASFEPKPIDVPILQCLPGRPWQSLGVGHGKWRRLTNSYYEFLGPDEIGQDSMLKPPNARLIAGAIAGCVSYLGSGGSN
jgi:thioesterase domain-containing protein